MEETKKVSTHNFYLPTIAKKKQRKLGRPDRVSIKNFIENFTRTICLTVYRENGLKLETP